MNIIEAHGIAMWRLEQVRLIIENFMTMGEDQKDPAQWAMFALGQVISIIDLSNEQVLERMS